MKAQLEDIRSTKGQSSFYAYRFQVPYFEFKWHYHPEYELTYIVKGIGNRIVGNSYEQFEDGDLVLLGSNLPHTWSNKERENAYSEAVVIQFSWEFIEPFLELQEGLMIKQMLESSVRGMRFKSDDTLVAKMMDITESIGMERILKLIALLEDLSKKQSTFIASNTFHNVVSKKNEMRINKACIYIQNNYFHKIKLKEVADLIHLTESNFCKFFKKATGKTYSNYLNELRINEACRMLMQSDKTINQISYDCGFETLSYFNRVFLEKKGSTPSKYKLSASLHT